jgi:methylated-DNA-protein-cysteine methyltransferase-like protein
MASRVSVIYHPGMLEDRVMAKARPDTNPFELIYEIVKKIPAGRVATYGQISRMMDGRYSPVFVGWALHALSGDRAEVPWHRVINSKGGVSTRRVLGYAPDLQKLLLIEEGIVFDEEDRCDLAVYRWDGGETAGREASPYPRSGRASRGRGRTPRA